MPLFELSSPDPQHWTVGFHHALDYMYTSTKSVGWTVFTNLHHRTVYSLVPKPTQAFRRGHNKKAACRGRPGMRLSPSTWTESSPTSVAGVVTINYLDVYVALCIGQHAGVYRWWSMGVV